MSMEEVMVERDYHSLCNIFPLIAHHYHLRRFQLTDLHKVSITLWMHQSRRSSCPNKDRLQQSVLNFRRTQLRELTREVAFL